MLVAWPRWSWRWNQWKQRWPQHGIFFCFCQLSDVGNGRWNSEKNPYLFDCVDVCYCGGSAKVMALSPKAWVHLSSVHVWSYCRGLYFFGESAEEQCLLTGRHVVDDRWISEQIGSPVNGKRCLQFLLRMAPLKD